MDTHRLYEGLRPAPDGESPVRHRAGIVDAVNTDGTADVDFGGVVVPDVSVLAGAVVAVGDVVQVMVWAGDLLVLGRVATSDAGSPLGWVAYAVVTSSQTGIGTSQTDLTGLSVTFTAVAGRRYKVTASLQFVRGTGTPIFATAQIKQGSGTPVYQEMIVETPSTAYSLTVQRSVILDEPTHLTAGSETIKVSAAASAATNITLSATTTRPAFLLVEDIGLV